MNPCLFENKTKLTDTVLHDWLDFYFNKIQKGKIVKNIVISIFMIVMGILLFCFRQEQMDLYFSLLWMILGGILFIYSLVNPTIQKRKQLKNFTSVTFNYEFYRDSFKIDGKMIHTEILYSRVARVYETEKYFYLYLYNHVVYVLSKNSFKKKELDSFRELMRENIKVYKDYR